ncbi:MAG: hypothetical protein P4L39_05480 [Humidesulfovibrio sp.]|nr:hypothetical protein [Humidesulfovibrio sp.]
METFTDPKQLVENPQYQKQRRKTLAGLRDGMIDAPILGVVNGFNTLPYCFTLQCCCGHFLHNDVKESNNLESLPVTNTISVVEYSIAYIAFCVENSDMGRRFLDALKDITALDPETIQFGSAEWFWKRQVNSYVLQVEPTVWKYEDTATLDYGEALRTEKVRDELFVHLQGLLKKQLTV